MRKKDLSAPHSQIFVYDKLSGKPGLGHILIYFTYHIVGQVPSQFPMESNTWTTDWSVNIFDVLLSCRSITHAISVSILVGHLKQFGLAMGTCYVHTF